MIEDLDIVSKFQYSKLLNKDLNLSRRFRSLTLRKKSPFKYEAKKSYKKSRRRFKRKFKKIFKRFVKKTDKRSSLYLENFYDKGELNKGELLNTAMYYDQDLKNKVSLIRRKLKLQYSPTKDFLKSLSDKLLVADKSVFLKSLKIKYPLLYIQKRKKKSQIKRFLRIKALVFNKKLMKFFPLNDANKYVGSSNDIKEDLITAPDMFFGKNIKYFLDRRIKSKSKRKKFFLKNKIYNKRLLRKKAYKKLPFIKFINKKPLKKKHKMRRKIKHKINFITDNKEFRSFFGKQVEFYKKINKLKKNFFSLKLKKIIKKKLIVLKKKKVRFKLLKKYYLKKGFKRHQIKKFLIKERKRFYKKTRSLDSLFIHKKFYFLRSFYMNNSRKRIEPIRTFISNLPYEHDSVIYRAEVSIFNLIFDNLSKNYFLDVNLNNNSKARILMPFFMEYPFRNSFWKFKNNAELSFLLENSFYNYNNLIDLNLENVYDDYFPISKLLSGFDKFFNFNYNLSDISSNLLLPKNLIDRQLKSNRLELDTFISSYNSS